MNYAQRVDLMFKRWEEARIAEKKGDADVARERLIDGLANSCLLLSDLESDTALNSVPGGELAWKTFRQMRIDGREKEFIEIERKLLSVSNLHKRTITVLVAATRNLIDFLVEFKPERDPHWRLRLSDIAGKVCAEARSGGSPVGRRSLEEAVLAGGGGLIMSLNDRPIIPVPEWVLSPSKKVGEWIVDHAVSGELDNLMERVASEG